MTLFEALKSAKQKLNACNIESASLDASLILSFLTQYSKVQLITHDNEVLSDILIKKYFSLIDKRATGYPTAYILGYKDFWSFTLKVTKDTLIPRPDTETLVQAALDCNVQGKVLDLGTGSGAIILALKSEYKEKIQAFACDYSQKALDVAMENSKNLDLEVDFRHSNWLSSFCDMKFSMIVSNPPYIESNDEHLNRSSLPFEPASALSSGIDGLDDIRIICKEAYSHLNEKSPLLIEHGFNQGLSVREIFESCGFKNISTIKDLENRDRVTIGFR